MAVPEGTLFQFLQVKDVILKYPREPGGLYTAYFDIQEVDTDDLTTFAGQGPS